MSVLADGQHVRAVRDLKGEAFKRDEKFRLWRKSRSTVALYPGLQALSELREFVFKFAAKNSCDAKRSQIVRVHWRIQAITTQISQWIHFAQGRDKFCGETRGRVHRQINRDQFCSSNRGLIKGLSGKIEANEVVPSLA